MQESGEMLGSAIFSSIVVHSIFHDGYDGQEELNRFCSSPLSLLFGRFSSEGGLKGRDRKEARGEERKAEKRDRPDKVGTNTCATERKAVLERNDHDEDGDYHRWKGETEQEGEKGEAADAAQRSPTKGSDGEEEKEGEEEEKVKQEEEGDDDDDDDDDDEEEEEEKEEETESEEDTILAEESPEERDEGRNARSGEGGSEDEEGGRERADKEEREENDEEEEVEDSEQQMEEEDENREKQTEECGKRER